MEKELQIFIIWENGRDKEAKVLKDIATKYEVLQTFVINWPVDDFARNLSRFYGKKIPKGCKKERECGTGGFLMIAAYDPKPNYVEDCRHECGSNRNAIHNKATYRKWTGGGFLIHASDNYCECKENLLFLLALTPQEFAEIYPANPQGTPIVLNQRMIGSDGWKSFAELENFVNKIGDCQIQQNEQNLRINTSNFPRICRLLNLKKRFGLFRKNSFRIIINGQEQNLTLRSDN